jgi:hypothetical protein
MRPASIHVVGPLLPAYFARMRRYALIFAILLLHIGAAFAGTGRIIKVLPHLLDEQGRHALSPSLYERDSYQRLLRQNPAKVSALRYDVQWKAGTSAKELEMRLEIRSEKNQTATPYVQSEKVQPRPILSRWTGIKIDKANYSALGRIIAWRVSLWDGTTLVAEQKSFLW